MTTPETPSWVNTPPQTGPLASGPGTLGGAASSAKTDPGPGTPPPAWSTQRPSAWGRVRDSVAGWSANSGQANGNGGDPITADDLAEHTSTLSDKIGELSSSISGMAGSAPGGGQTGAANMQQLTPSVGTRGGREAPPSPLAIQAQKSQAAQQQMAASQASMQAGMDRRAQINAGRAAASTGVKPAASAVGMSDAYAQKSFYGQQGSGLGTSASNWESARWSR